MTVNTPGKTQEPPCRGRRFIMKACLLLLSVLGAILPGCGKDDEGCTTCPTTSLEFEAGIYQRTVSFRECESGNVVFELVQYFSQCRDGTMEEGPFPCTVEGQGSEVSMACTIEDMPFGFEGCTVTAGYDLTGSVSTTGWSLGGSMSISDIVGPCLTMESCLNVETSGHKIMDLPSGSCGAGSGTGAAMITVAGGPAAGTYSTSEVTHFAFGSGEDRSHSVGFTVEDPGVAGIVFTLVTPGGFDAPGTFDPAVAGSVTIDETSGSFDIFYGEPQQTTGSVTITSISDDAIGGTFDCVITGEFVDLDGTEIQTRTISGTFVAGLQ